MNGDSVPKNEEDITINELQKFMYSDKEVRVMVKEGEPWFVAADVCKVLEVTNPTVALDRLDNDERAKFNLGRLLYQTFRQGTLSDTKGTHSMSILFRT